jgi:uncharacterized protein DUF1707
MPGRRDPTSASAGPAGPAGAADATGAGGSDADERSTLISLDEQHQAARLLREAFEAGELDRDELHRRLTRVQRAVTPRDLWKASGHRAGSRRRSDWKELRRAVWLQVGILCFAALAMLLVLYGTLLYYHGDHNLHVWPWEWGKR